MAAIIPEARLNAFALKTVAHGRRCAGMQRVSETAVGSRPLPAGAKSSGHPSDQGHSSVLLPTHTLWI